MTRTLLSFLFILITFASRSQYEAFKERKYVNPKDGNSISYRALYPKNYDSAKAYPLILFLHGGGERGSDNVAQLKWGSEMFSKFVQNHEVIILLPQCPGDDYWSSVKFDRTKGVPYQFEFNYNFPETKALRACVELVRSFIKDKKALKKQIYITGMSMGGMGSFEAVYRYPKLFAAASPICGGGDANSYSKKQAKLPFFIYHGADDNVVEQKWSDQMVAKLKELNARVEYKIYPGVKHDSWNNVFAEPDYLLKMLAVKK
jgi:predicted peptidase